MSRAARFIVILLIWAVVAGLLAWYVLARNPDYFTQPDSATFHDAALNMLDGEGFARFPGQPETFRTPGTSILLAGVYAVFGDSALPTIITQYLLVLMVALMAGCMAARMAQKRGYPATRAAFWAGAAVLFSPALMMSCVVLLSEITFTAVSVAAIWMLSKGLEDSRALLVFFGMLLVTASAFVRPVALYLPAFLFIGALPTLFTRRSLWITCALVLGVAVHVAATYAWSQRNAQVEGAATFAKVQEVNLYEYVAASVEAKAQGRDWEEVRGEYDAALEQVPEGERFSYMRSHSLGVIRANPVAAAKVWLRGAVVLAAQPATAQLATLFGLRESGSGIIYRFVSMPFKEFMAYAWENERALLLFMIPGMLWLGLFWLLAFIGILFSLRRAGPTLALLLAQTVYLVLVSSGPQTLDRFRVPIVPLCAVFLGVAIARLFRGRQSTLQPMPA